MLALLANSLAMGFGIQQTLSGAGGVAPYSYAVVAGGAGGTIDPASGLYTAPSGLLTASSPRSQPGIDLITVTDANLDTATIAMKIGTPLMLLCDIIQVEMGLADGQVYLWDQKIDIPTDSQIYVAVGVVSLKPFGSKRTMGDDGSTCKQAVNIRALVSIDILSRGPEARDRKEEVLLALNGNYAEQQMELNSFYVARMTSSFVNVSTIDGPAIPYRFNLSVGLQYQVSKTKAVPYYDTFTNPPTPVIDP